MILNLFSVARNSAEYFFTPNFMLRKVAIVFQICVVLKLLLFLFILFFHCNKRYAKMQLVLYVPIIFRWKDTINWWWILTTITIHYLYLRWFFWIIVILNDRINALAVFQSLPVERKHKESFEYRSHNIFVPYSKTTSSVKKKWQNFLKRILIS